MSLTEFLSMGGYGKYVWSSYGLCLLALAFNIILPKMKERKTIQTLQRKLHTERDKTQ